MTDAVRAPQNTGEVAHPNGVRTARQLLITAVAPAMDNVSVVCGNAKAVMHFASRIAYCFCRAEVV